MNESREANVIDKVIDEVRLIAFHNAKKNAANKGYCYLHIERPALSFIK